jgi:hypothetical protein
MDSFVLVELSDKLLGVIDDILFIMVKDLSADFIKTSYVPMNGTNHSFIAFQVDPVMFDIQLRAALRAKGLNVPEKNCAVTHVVSSSAEIPAPLV